MCVAVPLLLPMLLAVSWLTFAWGLHSPAMEAFFTFLFFSISVAGKFPLVPCLWETLPVGELG